MVTLTGVINDLHLPFGDDRAIQLVLDAFQDIGIDRLVLNGDILDFYNLNQHGALHPQVQSILETEIQSGQDFLSKCRKMFPDCEIIFNAGNHEFRLDRFIIDKCPAFWNFFQLESMLNMKELGIIYYPYNSRIQLEKTNLYFQHSPPSYSSAKAAYSHKHDQSSMYACTHRVESYARTGASGQVYQTFFNGWLGSTTASGEHQKVFSYVKGHENWQQCASLIAVKNETEFFVEQSVIKNYTIKMGGSLYEG